MFGILNHALWPSFSTAAVTVVTTTTQPSITGVRVKWGMVRMVRIAFTTWLALSSSSSSSSSNKDHSQKWTQLLDQHIGMALQKEATKQHHWSATLGAPTTSFHVDARQGKLHMGSCDTVYDVQLLGLESMDAFLWAWALTDEMKAMDPALKDIGPDLVCHDLKEKLTEEELPEFHTSEPIPLTTLQQGQTFADVAAGVLADTCRAIYQIPDYTSGLVYYWMIVDESFPLAHRIDDKTKTKTKDNDDTTFSPCEAVATMVERMVHPHASHRITSPTRAVTSYAEALGLHTVFNEDRSQCTATPANVFWSDSFIHIFLDPVSDKIMGLSAQYHGALHTTWVEYDEFGKFDKLDQPPSLDLATGLPIKKNSDDDDDDCMTKGASTGKVKSINGNTL